MVGRSEKQGFAPMVFDENLERKKIQALSRTLRTCGARKGGEDEVSRVL